MELEAGHEQKVLIALCPAFFQKGSEPLTRQPLDVLGHQRETVAGLLQQSLDVRQAQRAVERVGRMRVTDSLENHQRLLPGTPKISAQLVTSKASTTMIESFAAAFLRPVTSMTSVCDPDGRPLAV